MNIVFDKDAIDKFLNGEPLTKEYSYFLEENCEELEIYLASLLRSVSLEFLLEILFTIINELLVNAYKANSKRIFFQKKNQNINNHNSYEELLPLFRIEFGEFRDEWKNELEKSPYRIIFEIQNLSDRLTFTVRNNAPILQQERERIEARIRSSQKIRNLSEAYMENLDTLESSGLGIVLVKLLLKNSGILDNQFQVFSDDSSTSAYFEIPKIVIPKDTKVKIQNVIDEKIDRIPPFPENITRLLHTIKEEGAEISLITDTIEREPGLVIEILRLANSPLYMTRGKVSHLREAIQRIGLSQLEQILYAVGTKSSFPTLSHKIQEIWDHSIRTGFYSKKLIQLKNITADISLASTGGLIHDLGRMALATLETPVLKILNDLRVDKLMNQSEFIEEISLGTSHTEIGYRLGVKWNFPDELLDILRYHHRPWLYKGKHINELKIVYIADYLANLYRKPSSYAILDPEILRELGLDEPGLIKEWENKLYDMYRSYME